MYRDAWGEVDAGSDELPFFSYSMSVGDGENYLCVAEWGSDTEFSDGGTAYTREFDIFADGAKIGDMTVNNNKPDEVSYTFFKIPASLTAGKETVTVKLRAKNKNTK